MLHIDYLEGLICLLIDLDIIAELQKVFTFDILSNSWMICFRILVLQLKKHEEVLMIVL